MKKIIVFSALLLTSSSIFSQIEASEIGAEFHEVATYPEGGVQTYGSGKVVGSPYFYPNWTSGSVTTIRNKVITKDCLFIYDKITQQLYLKRKDSAIMEADRDQISAFTLNTDRVHYFVAGGKYDPSKKDDFFEVLVNNDKGYTLLKLIKTKFVKADFTDLLKVGDGDIYDKYQDDISYYISYKSSVPKKILLKEKDIKKILPMEKDKITAYFNQNRNANGIDATFLTGLVQSLNE
ncbi:MAG TPA: hypothetical protein VMU83_17595 [Hanamia sp.]|nr:hypothetical protein [Hanamia sp.]